MAKVWSAKLRRKSQDLNSRLALWRVREHWRGCAKALEGAREGIKREAALAYAFPLSPALHHRSQSLAPRLLSARTQFDTRTESLHVG